MLSCIPKFQVWNCIKFNDLNAGEREVKRRSSKSNIIANAYNHVVIYLMFAFNVPLLYIILLLLLFSIKAFTPAMLLYAQKPYIAHNNNKNI